MMDAALKREIGRDFVSRAPGHPIKLAEFVSTALPDPAAWRWCVIALTDLECVALSTGGAWKRADGGAL